ncbi:hypothetical protein ONO12_27455, partial [Salmonella enterica subsp. enterica serovar Montevideo]|nr:hypothetical protein [Salmonella enterica subsp. enterica serovar Montevideo]
AMLLLALFAVRWPILPVCCAWDPGNNAGTALLSERLRHLVLPEETERRRRERNEVEQDVEVAVREKNRDALERKLEIEQQEAFMT